MDPAIAARRHRAGAFDGGRAMKSPDVSNLPYRQGVGLCLFNKQGLVLVAERRDRLGAWQMPQGGVQKGEITHIAALREMKEEIGTDHAEIIGRTPEKLSYEFPDWMQIKDGVFRGKYRGQGANLVRPAFSGCRYRHQPDRRARTGSSRIRRLEMGPLGRNRHSHCRFQTPGLRRLRYPRLHAAGAGDPAGETPPALDAAIRRISARIPRNRFALRRAGEIFRMIMPLKRHQSRPGGLIVAAAVGTLINRWPATVFAPRHRRQIHNPSSVPRARRRDRPWPVRATGIILPDLPCVPAPHPHAPAENLRVSCSCAAVCRSAILSTRRSAHLERRDSHIDAQD